jgi:hypothetical protein
LACNPALPQGCFAPADGTECNARRAQTLIVTQSPERDAVINAVAKQTGAAGRIRTVNLPAASCLFSVGTGEAMHPRSRPFLSSRPRGARREHPPPSYQTPGARSVLRCRRWSRLLASCPDRQNPAVSVSVILRTLRKIAAARQHQAQRLGPRVLPREIGRRYASELKRRLESTQRNGPVPLFNRRLTPGTRQTLRP